MHYVVALYLPDIQVAYDGETTDPCGFGGGMTPPGADPQPPTPEELNQRLVEAVLEQRRLQLENQQIRVGLNQQVAELTRTVASLEAALASAQRPDQPAAETPAKSLTAAEAGPERRLPAWLRAVLGRSGLRPTAGQPAGLGAAEPLFVIGCPRSGTTVTAKILNAHPAVLMTNETAVFVMLGDLIRNSRTGYAAGIWYGKEHNQLWADHLAQHARALIEGYYARVAAASHKTRLRYWGEKHPHNAEYFDFIDALYPLARYLYIVRDPRDTALSIAAMKQIGFAEALAIWKNKSEPHEAFAATLPPERLCQWRYEDLVEDYAGVTRRLMAWLGLPAAPVEPFLAEYRNVDAHTLTLAEPVTADFRAKSVGRWRRALGDAERKLAVELAGDFMDKYGYER